MRLLGRTADGRVRTRFFLFLALDGQAVQAALDVARDAVAEGRWNDAITVLAAEAVSPRIVHSLTPSARLSDDDLRLACLHAAETVAIMLRNHVEVTVRGLDPARDDRLRRLEPLS